MSFGPKVAFILAAGRGTRMRELTDNCPKPLIKVNQRALIDYNVDKIKAFGIKTCFVNLYYKGDMIKEHLLATHPDMNFVFIEDWREGLETGGGIKQALQQLEALSPDGFFALNGDTIWVDTTPSALQTMAQAWNPQTMDILLLLEPKQLAFPKGEDGNYFLENGKPRRQKPGEKDIPYLYAGAQILHPRAFNQSPEGAFSLRELYDMAQKKERLGYVIYQGKWFHVGTPEAISIAEENL